MIFTTMLNSKFNKKIKKKNCDKCYFSFGVLSFMNPNKVLASPITPVLTINLYPSQRYNERLQKNVFE